MDKARRERSAPESTEAGSANGGLRPRIEAAGEKLDEFGDRLEDRVEAAQDFLHDLITDAKPKLRGWLHLATVPIVLVAGLTLTVLAPTVAGRAGAAIYTFTALLLFGVSAVYHRGNGWWNRSTHSRLKRLDHANIFFLILGSTTPFALLLLEGTPRILLLSIMGGTAVAGAALKFFWTAFPRWLSTVFYLVMGWIPVAFMGKFIEGAAHTGMAGPVALSLIAAGGLLYTLGAAVYGFKRPNPWPLTFGWHEVFHLFTVIAFFCHYIAVFIVCFAAV